STMPSFAGARSAAVAAKLDAPNIKAAKAAVSINLEFAMRRLPSRRRNLPATHGHRRSGHARQKDAGPTTDPAPENARLHCGKSESPALLAVILIGGTAG